MRFILALSLSLLCTSFSFAESGIPGWGIKVAVDQSTGQIYFSGLAYRDGDTDTITFLAGFNADGSLQKSFGKDGLLRISKQGDNVTGRSLVAKDGIVQGSAVNYSTTGGAKYLFYRVVNGQFDKNFGNNGQSEYQTTDFIPSLTDVMAPGLPSFGVFRAAEASGSATPMLVNINGSTSPLSSFNPADNKVIDVLTTDQSGRTLAGWTNLPGADCVTPATMDRWLADGNLDTSFGNGGHATLSVPFEGKAMMGQILSMPNGGFAISFAKMSDLQNCTIDYYAETTLESVVQMYDEHGNFLKQSPILPGVVGTATAEKSTMLLGPDGFIYYNADCTESTTKGSYIRRMSQDLVPDDSYNLEAYVEDPEFWNMSAYSKMFAIDSNSRIYTAGTYFTHDHSEQFAAFARFLPDGKVDRSFGDRGVAKIDVPKWIFEKN